MPAEQSSPAIEVVYEDKYLLVINKPAGTPVQPDKTGSPDVLGLLAKQLQLPDTETLLPVHRLDRPVGGLLAIARLPSIQTDLMRQMAGKGMEKTYHCVSIAWPEPAAGKLSDYLVKNERLNLTRVTNSESRAARLASLIYNTVSRTETTDGQKLALLEIRLETGRHHQIRVQMAHAGWPLWGDTKYNTAFRRSGGWHSLALCASGLGFEHPVNHQRVNLKIPLPDTFPFSLFSKA